MTLKVTATDYDFSKFSEINHFATGHHEDHTLLIHAKGGADAMVILSSDPYLNDHNHFEICIGCGDNTWTGIREKKEANPHDKADSHHVLSSDEYRGIWIKFHRDGHHIQVGKEGHEHPIVKYTGHKRIPINYFSLGTWRNRTMKYKVNKHHH